MSDQRTERLAALERAIDEMNLEQATSLLDQLDEMEPDAILPEDPKLFAARMQALHDEKEKPMRQYNAKRILILAACIAAALSLGVYASGVWRSFSFASGDAYVTVTTDDQSMTEQKAKELAGQTREAAPQEGDKVIRLTEEEFASIEEASEALALPVALPAIPEGYELQAVSGADFGFQKLMHITYADGEKRLGITLQQRFPSPDGGAEISFREMEEGSMGRYQSAAGYEFTTLREGDGNGRFAEIFTVPLGDYEYSLVFFGLSEQELHAVVDSADLSVYE